MSNKTSLVGTRMYLPVTVADKLGDDNVLATYKSCTGAERRVNVLTDSLISPEYIETNSTKDYYTVLNAFMGFDNATRKGIWGCESVEEAFAIPFAEFIQMYQNFLTNKELIDYCSSLGEKCEGSECIYSAECNEFEQKYGNIPCQVAYKEMRETSTDNADWANVENAGGKAESADEYRKLMQLYEDSLDDTRRAVWGCVTMAEALDIPAHDFIAMYNNAMPKTGEIWEKRYTGGTATRVFVLYYKEFMSFGEKDDGKVHFFYMEGKTGSDGVATPVEFIRGFRYTGERKENLLPLVNDLSACLPQISQSMGFYKSLFSSKENLAEFLSPFSSYLSSFMEEVESPKPSTDINEGE